MAAEACYCRRCVPNDAAAVCSRCGEEIRFGTRDEVLAWWHRLPVDHAPIHGHVLTASNVLELRRQEVDVVRYYDDGKSYTTAEHDISRDKDVDRRNHRLAELRGQDPDYVEPLPPVEVACHPIEPDSFPPRSGIRQVINLVEKTEGWERYRLTHARGPYTSVDGKLLSISDTVTLGARARQLDGSLHCAVASWRDGKFDFAFIGILRNGHLNPQRVDATTMKNWIKGTHDLQDAVQPPGE